MSHELAARDPFSLAPNSFTLSLCSGEAESFSCSLCLSRDDDEIVGLPRVPGSRDEWKERESRLSFTPVPLFPSRLPREERYPSSLSQRREGCTCIHTHSRSLSLVADASCSAFADAASVAVLLSLTACTCFCLYVCGSRGSDRRLWRREARKRWSQEARAQVVVVVGFLLEIATQAMVQVRSNAFLLQDLQLRLRKMPQLRYLHLLEWLQVRKGKESPRDVSLSLVLCTTLQLFSASCMCLELHRHDQLLLPRHASRSLCLASLPHTSSSFLPPAFAISMQVSCTVAYADPPSRSHMPSAPSALLSVHCAAVV